MLGVASRQQAEQHSHAVEAVTKREAAAEKIMMGKQLLVDLDRRKNQVREGIRALEKQIAKSKALDEQQQQQKVQHNEKSNSYLFASISQPSNIPVPLAGFSGASTPPGEFPVWILCEDVFMQAPSAERVALPKLRKDLVALEEAVSAARIELNEATVELAELEGVDSALAQLHKGFELKPINK